MPKFIYSLLKKVVSFLWWELFVLYCHLTKPVTLTVSIGDSPLNPLQKQPILVTETDAAGNIVPVVASNLTFAVTDPTVATLSADDLFVVAVAPGITTLTVTDTVNSLVGTVTVTVTAAPDVPTLLTVTLGPAVAA